MQPLLQWKNSMYYILWVCICSPRYPACSWLSSVACPALQYFSTLSHKQHDFRKKKKVLNIKCVFLFFLQRLSETSLILRRIQRDMIKNVCWCSCEVQIFLVRFKRNLNFVDRFSKNTQISNFMETSSSGSRVVPRGQTDTPKLLVTWQFSERA